MSLFDREPPKSAPITLRLVQPDVRISNPHVGMNGGIHALYESMRDENTAPVPELSPDELAFAQKELSVGLCYAHHLMAWRRQQRIDGKIAQGTLSKELQSVRCFDRFDCDFLRAPRDWPSGVPWKGLPVGYVAQKYFEEWIRTRLYEGYAIPTMEGRWCHVRTVLNMMKRMGAIGDLPDIDFAAIVTSFQRAVGNDDYDDIVPTTYTRQQHVGVYQRLHEPDMRAAWVLGSNGGPRTVDLFSLRWSANVRLGERPELFYTANKTGKRHWVPLHPITVKHLRRLIALQGHLDPDLPQGLVFPRLTSHAVDPEKGRPARRRNERIKQVMQECGM
ncbi:MAG TPA: hypothetical protein VGM98_23660, partial [Schlesneria sp.]